MARKPLSTAFGAQTREFCRGDFYPPVRDLHAGVEALRQTLYTGVKGKELLAVRRAK